MCPQLWLYLLQTAQPSVTTTWWYAPHQGLSSTGRTALIWGLQQYRQERFGNALYNFKAALHQCTQMEDWVGVGKSLNGLSAVYLHCQQYERSLAYSQASRTILATTTARQDYALAVYQLGVSHLKLGNGSAAEPYLEEALAAYQAQSDALNENRVLLHLGQLYAQRQQFMFALACYEAVLDHVLDYPQQGPPPPLLIDVLQLIQQVFDQTNHADLAIAPLLTLEPMAGSGNAQDLTQVFRQLGHMYETQQQYSLAVKCYAHAYAATPMATVS